MVTTLFPCVCQERKFQEKQQEAMDKAMRRLGEQHREKVALLERQFLQQKQQLLRGQCPRHDFLRNKSVIDATTTLSMNAHKLRARAEAMADI